MPKKHAAIGVQMHSGWGVLIAVSSADSLELLDRKRIVVVDPAMPGGKQPYHHARLLLDGQNLAVAERYLEEYAAACEQMATFAIKEAVLGVRSQGYRIVGTAILQGAGRPLPPLAQILAAHPLIHTAEGEFFCRAARIACERLKIPVTGIRRRNLDERAKISFGKRANQLKRNIANLGKPLGPPWTADHKDAVLAAVTILAGG
jgi:hypothetical protein